MEPKPRKALLVAGACILGLAGLTLLAAACLPYAALKGLADNLAGDGNFTSLKEGNALVYRLLLGVAGVVLLGLAAGLLSGRLSGLRSWGARYLSDLGAFFRALRQERGERLALAGMLLVLLLALVYRLQTLNGVMTHDEAYTFVEFSSGSLFNALTNYHLPNNHILNSLLIHLATRLFGIQPWIVRLPALTAGLLLIPVTFFLARALYDRYTALAACLLVAVLPGAILYSTSGRGYSLVALFTLLGLWLALSLLRAKNLFAWSLLVLCGALGFYAVPVFLFPFGVVYAWLLLEGLATSPGGYRSRTDFLACWFLAGTATAVLVLLFYTPVFIYSGIDKVFANHWVTPESWAGYLPNIPRHLGAAWQEWVAGWPAAIQALLGLGFLLGLIFHRRLATQRVPLQAAAFLWLALLVLVQRPIGVQKIWAFLQAPFMIWAAAGLVGIFKHARLRLPGRPRVAAVVVVAGLLAGCVAAVRILPGLPARWAEIGPAESTVLAIQAQLEAQDLIIIDTPMDAAVWYYSLLHGLGRERFDRDRSFERLFVIVSRTDAQTLDSVLQNRGPDPARLDLAQAQLVVNYQSLDTYLVPGR